MKHIVLALLLTVVVLPARAGDLPDRAGLDREEQERVRQGEIVAREIPTPERLGTVMEAVGMAEAPLGIVVDVLMEHERYPEFMPNVGRVEVVEANGTRAVLDYTLDLPLDQTKQYRIATALARPDEDLAVISWEKLPRPDLTPEETIADTSGFWRIEAIAPDRSLVLYHVYTDPGPVPFGFGWIVDLLSKESVPEVVASTRERASARSQASTE